MKQFERISDFRLEPSRLMRKIRAGAFLVFLYLLIIVGVIPGTNVNAEPMAFSQLSIQQQRQVEMRLAPPPISQRDVPYSTPMYYLFHKGFQAGIGSAFPERNGTFSLKANRPDWQEALIRDWVELGLTSTLYLTTPSEWEDPYLLQAMHDYIRLSRKHGLKVAIRLSGDDKIGGLEASGWDLHPLNPANKLEEYLAWAGQVADALRGKVDHYILGDELNLGWWERPEGSDGETKQAKVEKERRWTPEIYMKVFPLIAQTLKEKDPKIDVSMFGMSGLDWDYVSALLEQGYADDADGIAVNFDIINRVPDVYSFASKVRRAQPTFKVFSNGVGYIAARDTNYYPTNYGGESYSDYDQAALVAKTMFFSFDADFHSAPYYTIIRQWVLPDGSAAPHWYGMFGFADLCVDDYNHLTVKHHPAWYAFQTIANIFYSRSATQPASFKLQLSQPVDFQRVYVRNDYELLIVLWNDEAEPREVSVTVPTRKFSYPVQVDLFNYHKTMDIAYHLEGNDSLVMTNITVSDQPVILRLVHEK
jgi:hypothetical protein